MWELNTGMERRDVCGKVKLVPSEETQAVVWGRAAC